MLCKAVGCPKVYHTACVGMETSASPQVDTFFCQWHTCSGCATVLADGSPAAYCVACPASWCAKCTSSARSDGRTGDERDAALAVLERNGFVPAHPLDTFVLCSFCQVCCCFCPFRSNFLFSHLSFASFSHSKDNTDATMARLFGMVFKRRTEKAAERRIGGWRPAPAVGIAYQAVVPLLGLEAVAVVLPTPSVWPPPPTPPPRHPGPTPTS